MGFADMTKEPLLTSAGTLACYLTSGWRQQLCLFLLWLVVWQIGYLVEYTHHASVWFPAAGLTFAALLLLGFAAVPALVLVAVTVTVWTVQHYQLALNGSNLGKPGYYLPWPTLRLMPLVRSCYAAYCNNLELQLPQTDHRIFKDPVLLPYRQWIKVQSSGIA